jgi:hypothetical protein
MEENELRISQSSPVSQISMNRSTFYMIYMVVIGFWLHDRNIFNCFIAAFCLVCRMGGTGLTFDMIYISAIGQLVNWSIALLYMIYIASIGLLGSLT